ncbi:MAG: bifunctional aspartate kinase/homoserine dehydrogenase I [bacterium]|nr:bifunctional aspartate kinase/homoserine dehydrogenase I [bacterium]
MKVLKFGGTSVGTPDAIRNVATIVEKTQQGNEDPIVVVCSAFSEVTNQLIKAANLAKDNDQEYKGLVYQLGKQHLDSIDQLFEDPQEKRKVQAIILKTIEELERSLNACAELGQLPSATHDKILSCGERLSTSIVAHYLQERGLEVAFLDARKVIRTDKNHGDAQVDFAVTNKNIQHYMAEQRVKIQVVTGFIGATADGQTTTLGRGGSDYTATIFGAALGVDRVVLYKKDVNGVCTADPKRVPNAKALMEMSYNEAAALTTLGAKVIHPAAMVPVQEKNIPIEIRNTTDLETSGTLVSRVPEKNGDVVKGISSLEEVSLVTLKGPGLRGVIGTSARLYEALSKSGVNVILAVQDASENNICVAVNPSDEKKAKKAIEDEFYREDHQGLMTVESEGDFAIISVVGDGMIGTHGMMGQFATALGNAGVNIHAVAQGSSENSISAVIKRQKLDKALQAVHDKFFEHILRLFVVGATGNIGKTLLEQVRTTVEQLWVRNKLKIVLSGVASSKKMFLNSQGIGLNEWEKALLTKGGEMSFTNFTEKMKQMDLPNAVFVDCTAEETITELYESILRASISIVTPNKKAMTGELEKYKGLKKAAEEKKVGLRFDTTAAAGLGVISRIKELRDQGDQINRIEAVLSGTLSYIFNTFDGTKPFSEVVKEAKQAGYTESDPRDDLNGMDVARKILILARESGYDLEPGNIQVQGLLNDACHQAGSVEEFFTELKKMDSHFETMRLKAEQEGKALRYIARFSKDEQSAKVALEAVPKNHPFAGLSGADNSIAISTEYYDGNSPDIKRGPGAGKRVTAGGVYNDIVKVGSSQKQ